MVNVIIIIRAEIKVFIVASDTPNIEKVTSLQLIGLFFNCFKISVLSIMVVSILLPQTKDSAIKPCSIPTWYIDNNVPDKKIMPNIKKDNFSKSFEIVTKIIIIIVRI